MARKILLSRRDYLQDSSVVLSSGIWNPNLPLTNILNHKPQFVAEASGNSWEATKFDVDLGQVRNRIGLFFFANLYTSSLGLLRLRASLSSDLSSPTYDTGNITTWPQDSTAGDNTIWGDFSLNGVYSREEYFSLGMPRFFIPSEVISARYLRVEIFDQTSGDFLKIGCFGACEVWESPIDFAPAPQITIIDESDVSRVPFGSQFVNQRRVKRRFNFGFPALEKAEILSRTLGMALIKGKSKPLVAVSFPDETASLEKTSVYGLVSSDNVLSNPFFGHYAQPFQIDQLI